jgi:hypothetical protein
VAIAGQLTNCPDCGEIILKEIPTCQHCGCTINAAEQQTYVAPYEYNEANKTHEAHETHEAHRPQEPRKKVKRGYAAAIVSVVMALIVVLLGLYFYQTTQQQSEQRAFQNAISSGEPAVLQNFLDVYAAAPVAHRDSIAERLAQLMKVEQEWLQALNTLDRQKLATYVSRHPGNIHVTEANLLIDSLDWQKALSDNTVEGYQVYLDEHPEGANVPEARDRHDQLDSLRLKPEDQMRINQLMSVYLKALQKRDEPSLRSVLAQQLTYMKMEQATPNDAVDHMNGLFGSDIISIDLKLAGEWDIEKKPATQEGFFVYSLSGTVEERIDRMDPTRERFISYKVTAEINAKGKISAVNMQRVI